MNLFLAPGTSSFLYNSLKKVLLKLYLQERISFPFCDLTLFNYQQWVPSLPGPIRQVSPPLRKCSWEKKGALGHHGRAAFRDDSGVGSAGLGAQWRGEERPLVWGDTCACVSEDRRAQPFGEFPVVLSLTSAQDVLCPDNLAPPPCLALNVCSHHMLLWFLCLNVHWCVHVTTQLWRLKVILW